MVEEFQGCRKVVALQYFCAKTGRAHLANKSVGTDFMYMVANPSHFD